MRSGGKRCMEDRIASPARALLRLRPQSLGGKERMSGRTGRPREFDYIVVGAGSAGCVLA